MVTFRLSSFALCLAFLPLPSTCEKLYAFRSDGNLPDIQFWKLCYQRHPGKQVRLTQEATCGIGFHDEWSLKKVFELEDVRHRDAWDYIYKQLYKMEKDPTKPEKLWKEYKDRIRHRHDAFMAESGIGAAHITTLAWVDEPPRFKRESTWHKVLLDRDIPDQPFNYNKGPTKTIHFNSNVEFGAVFEKENFEKPENKWGPTTPVDMKLDVVTMGSDFGPYQNRRYKLLACRRGKGFNVQSSDKYLELFIFTDPNAPVPSDRCFPITLTKSENLVHHAKDAVKRGNLLVPQEYFVYRRDNKHVKLLTFKRKDHGWVVTKDNKGAYLPGHISK